MTNLLLSDCDFDEDDEEWYPSLVHCLPPLKINQFLKYITNWENESNPDPSPFLSWTEASNSKHPALPLRLDVNQLLSRVFGPSQKDINALQNSNKARVSVLKTSFRLIVYTRNWKFPFYALHVKMQSAVMSSETKINLNGERGIYSYKWWKLFFFIQSSRPHQVPLLCQYFEN